MSLLLNVNGELASSSQLRTATETTSLGTEVGNVCFHFESVSVMILEQEVRLDRRHYEVRSYSEKEQSYE